MIDWDESLYFLMAEQWRSGHLPYIALWDNKPIGIYAIFAVFQAIFGDTIFSIRIATVVFISITAFLTFKIVAKLEGVENAYGRLAGVMSGVLLIICSVSDNGLAANTEIFFTAFTAGAALCLADQNFLSDRTNLKCFVVGALAGIAFMIKYVIVFEAMTFLWGLLFLPPGVEARRLPGAIAAYLVGAALPLLATVLLYAASGDLSPWFDASVAANLRRADTGITHFSLIQAKIFLKWLPLYVAALVVFVNTIKRPREPFQFFIMIWLGGSFLGAFAAESFYSHYFVELLPPLCVCFGLTMLKLRRHVQALSWPVNLVLLAGVLLIPLASGGIALKEVIDQRVCSARIASDITEARVTSPFSTYVFDYEPIIYALTKSRLPTKFAYPAYVTTCALSKVAGDRPQDVLRQVLSADPQFVVVADEPISELTRNEAVYTDLRSAITRRYAKWRTYDVATVYRLRPGPLSPLRAEAPVSCGAAPEHAVAAAAE